MTLFPVFLLTCVAAGAAGVFFRPGAWYRNLDKPAWTPPNWAFPVIWAALYGCRRGSRAKRSWDISS